MTPAPGEPATNHGESAIREPGTGMPHGELARIVLESGALEDNPPGRMIERVLRRLGIVAMLR